jgi:molybdopterin/thiamine biosynthesis adenylyltransferase
MRLTIASWLASVLADMSPIRRARKRGRKGAGNGRVQSGQGRRAAQAAAPPGPGTPQAAEATARSSSRVTWWTHIPERFDREVTALQEAGYDPQPQVVAGRMRIGVTVAVGGVEHQMEVRYPDLYPLFRFHIYAPVELFPRHQHPFTGALCVLGQGPGTWDEDDTAADLLKTQLPRIEAANREQRPDLETDQIEPVSAYVMTIPGGVFVLPAEAYAIDRRQQNGEMTIMISSEPPRPPRGFVTQIGSQPATLPDLSHAFPNARARVVTWKRIEKLPAVPIEKLPDALVASGAIPPARKNDRPFSLFALAFDEEVEYGEPLGTGWLFFVRIKESGGYRVGFIRAERYAIADQAARIRDVTGLDAKHVVLFGLGAIGAPAAHLLLQARVKLLRVVDHDTLVLGNAVRWPLGFQMTGIHKCQAFALFARANYPETTIEPMGWQIGASHNDGDPDEGLLLERAFANVDLAIDATADLDVQHLLAYEARIRGIPLISVEAREGAYGGRVARFRPEGACRTCLKHYQNDGKFLLPADEQGTIQPAGCVTPSFTGGSFDLVPLSAIAVRLAVQTLVANEHYPDANWDIASLWNRESNTGEIGSTPRWEFAKLEIHPSCPEH